MRAMALDIAPGFQPAADVTQVGRTTVYNLQIPESILHGYHEARIQLCQNRLGLGFI